MVSKYDITSPYNKTMEYICDVRNATMQHYLTTNFPITKWGQENNGGISTECDNFSVMDIT